MHQKWLGIDPGLAIIGWAILEGDEPLQPRLIDCGIIETEKKLSTPQRLVEIERDMMALVEEFQPDRVAIEMPFFNRQIKAAGGVIQALGVIDLVIYRETNCLPVFLHQSSWKCHLGNGRATKAEVTDVLQRIFNLKKIPTNDSVDAIGIAFAAFQGVRNQIE